jgi:hypothetical protein
MEKMKLWRKQDKNKPTNHRNKTNQTKAKAKSSSLPCPGP